MNRKLIATLSLLVAGCGDTASTDPDAGFSQPSAIALFDGLTSKDADEVRPYLAIVNAGGDELVLVDPVDDEAVRAPVLVRSLVVPLPDARPTIVAAADLADDVVDDTVDPPKVTRTPDLLVVVGSGATSLQLVQTWGEPVEGGGLGAPAPSVVAEHEVELGAPVLALVAMPVPDLDNGFVAKAGQARVIASLPGARLAIVDYARQPDGTIAPAGPVAFQDLFGVDAVSLAWDPADLRHLYAATPDPIPTGTGPVEGVAAIDMNAAPGAWTVSAIDARGPTSLVAAWTLRERVATGQNATLDTLAAFAPGARRRVYAFLDLTRCGPTERTPCGIAVLDPVAGGPVADPSGRMPYLAPIPVAGVPTGLTISGPPARPPPLSPAFETPGVMKVMYGVAERGTTAVMAVPTTSGSVFYVDLGRWAIPSSQSVIKDEAARTAVTGAVIQAFTVVDPNNDRLTVPQSIAIWSGAFDGGEEVQLRTDSGGISSGVTVTPGYTPNETWTISYQGVLSGLDLQPAETGRTEDGRTWIALQVTLPEQPGQLAPRVAQVARLYDPSLGLRAGPFGDFVIVSTKGRSGSTGFTCPDQSAGRAAELLEPTPERPGGAVVLEPLPCDGLTDAALAACEAQRSCVEDVLREGEVGLVATVRASDRNGTGRELMVEGAALGYVGRTTIAGTVDSPFEFRLEYPRPPVDEDTLAASCPLVPWPYPENFETPPAVPACDATCRASCEALVLARKARRIHHLSEKCEVNEPTCRTAWPAARYAFPVADGPLVAFRATFGITRIVNGSARTSKELREPTPGLAVIFTTRSGISPSFRAPTTSDGAASFPRGAAAFDRSPFAAGDGYRFFVPYADDHVLDFSPSQLAGAAEVIR